MNRISMILIVLIVSSAFASQVHYRDISLEDLVQDSTFIVVARPAQSYYVTNTLVLKCKGLKRVKMKVVSERFVVEQVLAGQRPGLTNQAVIIVHMAHEAWYIDETRMYECEGITESTIVDFYERDSQIKPGDKRVLFLIPQANDYAYSIENGYESVDKISEIKKWKEKDSQKFPLQQKKLE